MSTLTLSRSIYGQSFKYKLDLEPDYPNNTINVKVHCLQGPGILDAIGNSPELIRNQLIEVATTGVQQINEKYKFREYQSFNIEEKDISLQAQFTL